MTKKTLRYSTVVFINGLFFVLMCLLQPVHASGPEGLSIDDIHVDTGEYERLLKGIPMSVDPEMLEKAKHAVPGDINERVEKEKSKLIEKGYYGMDSADGVSEIKTPGLVDNGHSGTTILKEDERIYIFISSSVPRETLRNYARDLDAIGQPRISIVMRGFVGGMTKVRPTLEFLRGVLFKDENCYYDDKCEAYRAPILIDPLLFRRYGIEIVPAIAYAKGVRVMDSMVSEGVKEGVETVDDYFVLYGDAAMEGALELINREARSGSLDCLVGKIKRGGGYKSTCK